MHRLLHRTLWVSASWMLIPAATALAAGDPNAPPPDNAGGMIAPPPQQPIEVTVQPPPPPVQPPPPEAPPRQTFMAAAVPTFHLPLLGGLAASHAYGGGLNVLVGYAFGNLALAFSPGLFYYGNGTNGEVAYSLGAVLRYTILRDVVIHPFGELGLDYAGIFGAESTAGPLSNRTNPSIGGSLALGAEYDVTDHLSLQLAVRASALYGLGNGNGDLLFTPYFSVVYYR